MPRKHVNRVCVHCGSTYSIPAGEPNRRKYCDRHCKRAARRERESRLESAGRETMRRQIAVARQGIERLNNDIKKIEARISLDIARLERVQSHRSQLEGLVERIACDLRAGT